MNRGRLTALAAFAVLPAVLALAARYDEKPNGAIIVSWNETAYAIAFAEDSFRTFKGHRAFAMMHLAMHDAVNAVMPRYRQYAFFGRDSLADAGVAAAHAAHDVLREAYPNADAILSATLARTAPRSQNRASPSRSIALGQKAAAAIVNARRNDGFDARGTYTFRDGAGAYRTTPPWDGFVVQPGFGSAKPFGLTTPAQFRPPPPPSVDSREYASAFNEVRRVGAIHSTERSADQTAYAVWWMEFAEGSVNRLARRLAIDRGLSVVETARLFALLNVGLFDSYVAVWNAKYEYNHWRPYTAIREAARDGNAATEPDSSWEPLRPTPPFPEYVSAHAAGCAASFDALVRVFGDGPLVMETLTAAEGMPSRRFASFRDAAAECADSRVRLGWHFRYATDAGLELGRAVAGYVATHRLSAVPSDPKGR